MATQLPKDKIKCSCGRLAIVKVDDEFLCWEAWLKDTPMKWKDKYSDDKEPRHANKTGKSIHEL